MSTKHTQRLMWTVVAVLGVATTVIAQADGTLYYVSRTGGAFVIAAKPEFELLAHNDVEDESIFDASLAVSGGRLLLRSNPVEIG